MSDSADFDIRKVIEFVAPILDDMGFELIDIEYLSEHGRWILRIYADKEGGITLDDCVHVSKEIGVLIDIKDIIKNEYVLEVSSPGLNRPLKKEKDFLWAIGKKVKVRMSAAVKGRRRFTGYLKNFQENILYLEVEKEIYMLPFRDIEKANLVYEFEMKTHIP
jgi:ribosome maturation factor RimP